MRASSSREKSAHKTLLKVLTEGGIRSDMKLCWPTATKRRAHKIPRRLHGSSHVVLRGERFVIFFFLHDTVQVQESIKSLPWTGHDNSRRYFRKNEVCIIPPSVDLSISHSVPRKSRVIKLGADRHWWKLENKNSGPHYTQAFFFRKKDNKNNNFSKEWISFYLGLERHEHCSAGAVKMTLKTCDSAPKISFFSISPLGTCPQQLLFLKVNNLKEKQQWLYTEGDYWTCSLTGSCCLTVGPRAASTRCVV